MLPDTDANSLGELAMTFEEFLVREKSAGRLELEFGRLPEDRVLVHGHCHQKAFGGMPAVTESLSWVPGLQVDSVTSSCCGMAGAFGYDAKTIDVSLQMADLALLPAVREAGDDTIIVADGTSCRQQIRDGTQREARHVARVLADAIE